MISLKTILFILMIAWAVAWKGVALWKAGRNNQLWWFVAILVINTLGVLEIVYLLAFQKDSNECCCEDNCKCPE